jgi:hypothetical protein
LRGAPLIPEITGVKSLSDDIVTNLRNYGTISHVPAATMALAGLVYFLLRQFV